MAASKHRLFAAFRLSRKLTFVTGGLLLLLGASGTAALLVSGPATLIPGFGEEGGGHCKTLYQAEFPRSGENRVVAIVQSDDIEPERRVRTGLRLAMHLSETLHPDLVTVQMAGWNGPSGRAELRGAAIGAEIVLAPNPNRTRATNRNWEVRYVDAAPTELGYFYGTRTDMDLVEIELASKAIPMIEGCDGDVVETAKAAPAAGAHEAAPAAGHAPPAH